MQIDKTSFLLLAGTLAAGGAGGYLLHQRGGLQLRPSAPPPPATPAAPSVVPTATAAPSAAPSVEPKPAQPACDDSQGEPEACPPVPAPSDEGMACSWAAKRCADYKQAFKPKPAQKSVSCLRKLVGPERCDPYRANLCGHKALMAACHETPPESDGADKTTPASGKPSDTASKLGAQCEAIVKACEGSVPETTVSDCYRTLSGMNELGRANMVECMKKHCIDKGLFGCEALPPQAAR